MIGPCPLALGLLGLCFAVYVDAAADSPGKFAGAVLIFVQWFSMFFTRSMVLTVTARACSVSQLLMLPGEAPSQV